jgi:DNA-binding response OmpR family regulator
MDEKREGRHTETRRVLIAAPPGRVQEGLQVLLGALPDVRVMVTAEGRTARSAIAAGTFDLVILDGALPPDGGLDVLNGLPAMISRPHIIALADDAADIALLREAGADTVRVKGYPAGQLLTLIKQHLEETKNG